MIDNGINIPQLAARRRQLNFLRKVVASQLTNRWSYDLLLSAQDTSLFCGNSWMSEAVRYAAENFPRDIFIVDDINIVNDGFNVVLQNMIWFTYPCSKGVSFYMSNFYDDFLRSDQLLNKRCSFYLGRVAIRQLRIGSFWFSVDYLKRKPQVVQHDGCMFCKSHEAEDAMHLFFSCVRWSDARKKMIEDIHLASSRIKSIWTDLNETEKVITILGGCLLEDPLTKQETIGILESTAQFLHPVVSARRVNLIQEGYLIIKQKGVVKQLNWKEKRSMGNYITLWHLIKLK